MFCPSHSFPKYYRKTCDQRTDCEKNYQIKELPKSWRGNSPTKHKVIWGVFKSHKLNIFGSASNGVGFVALYRERSQEPGTYQVLDYYKSVLARKKIVIFSEADRKIECGTNKTRLNPVLSSEESLAQAIC